MKSIFKFLLATAFVALVMPDVGAQVLQRQLPNQAKDSVTGAGTKYFSLYSTASGVVGISFVGLKAATGGGTLNSYVVLQVRSDTMPGTSTSYWEDYIHPCTGARDTLFIADGTDTKGKLWSVPTQYFNGIRAKVVSTGAQKFYVWYSALRR